MKQKFNVEESPKSFAYVIERDTHTIRCNRCNSIVLKSDNKEYEYQCLNCDEDLYSIETHEGDYHTDEELDQLCCDVRDLLLLDN